MAEPTRRLPVLLIASLVANGVLVGLIAGVLVSRSGDSSAHSEGDTSRVRAGRPPFEQVLADAALDQLPEEDRRAQREALRAFWGSLRPKVGEVRRLRADVARRLGAEPFDRAAVEDALAAQLAAEADLRRAMTGRALDVFERLTPEERAAAIDRLGEQRLRRGGRLRDGRRARRRPD